jgi:2,4-dienoyl-CoA reductase (NADPH2)
MDRLDRLGVAVHVRAPVERITRRAVYFTPAGGTVRALAADSVVLAGTVQPDTALFDALVATLPDMLPGTEVLAAGDCSGLGLIRKATEEGARAACSI